MVESKKAKRDKYALFALAKTIASATILKFLSVGGFCAGLSLAIMYVLISGLGINYLIATIITIFVTNFIGFSLNKYYTFRTHQREFWREIYKYYSVMLSSYILNLCIMYALVDIVNIWYLYANVVCILLLTPFNYLLHKKWSFRRDK